MKDFFKYKDTEFDSGTPIELCDILLELAKSKKKITIKIGSEDWHEKITNEGYLIRSVGKHAGIFMKPNIQFPAGRLYSSIIHQIYDGDTLIYESKK